MGRNCNQVRNNILNMDLPEQLSGRVHLEDTTASYPLFSARKKQSSVTLEQQREKYYDVLRKTKFALAPKGAGLSSIRQFEAMSYGCVPVIISDQLKLPFIVDWKKFAVIVNENQFHMIPDILLSIEEKFPEMSKASFAAYGKISDPQSYWRYVEEAIIDISNNDMDKRVTLVHLKFDIMVRVIRRTIYRIKNRII